jgi:hypothetical protein
MKAAGFLQEEKCRFLQSKCRKPNRHRLACRKWRGKRPLAKANTRPLAIPAKRRRFKYLRKNSPVSGVAFGCRLIGLYAERELRDSLNT